MDTGNGLPRRPLGSGDEWVELPDGRRFWGRYGAAGLLVAHPEAGVLLQHRAGYSHFGGTWGLPGGARHQDESPVQAAVREAGEEAGVPAGALQLRLASRLELPPWSYTTVVATVEEPFVPVIGDAESIALRWVPDDEVDSLPLHPGFADSWPMLRGLLGVRPTLLVDVANVMGSRPDGWWRDRAGAAGRVLGGLSALAGAGMPSADFGLPGSVWWPRVAAVLEGEAKAAPDQPDVEIVRAPRDGDGAVVDFVGSSDAPERVTVVTADRGLRDRVERLGARVLGPGRLWDLIDEALSAPRSTPSS
ncbi:NUDIX domain-containing protein [Naasia aerilata]|uniref:NTP pyrophosphohydrolase n=1 Tax=Naasia aerilata TaxID=1162966 RepID=A0ABN6XVK3_9MICO|nr:NUDIX hydrolase [Naasia aerilata]BDZ47393.1 NTP pyrophosphohydrolase [Naasia aerilata]